MSNVRGKISIDVQFADSTTSAGVQSLKTITLQDTTEYTSGKVAVVTGTVAANFNATINLSPMSPAYRDSSGNVVSFSDVTRVAFQSSRECVLADMENGDSRTRSRAGLCSVESWTMSNPQVDVIPMFSSGTASYTLVLYGT